MGKPLEGPTVKFGIVTMPTEIETFRGLVDANPGDYVLDTNLGFNVLSPDAFRVCYQVISEDNGEGTAKLILPRRDGIN